LRFNLINLIKKEDDDAKKQTNKLGCLSSILQEAFSESENNEKCRADTADTRHLLDNEFQLPDELAPFKRFLCNSPHEVEHRGNFQIFPEINNNNDSNESNMETSFASSIPTIPNYSLPPNVLFSQERQSLLSFLRDSSSLSYKSAATLQKRGGMMYDSSEAVVWCCNDKTFEELEFASKVLDDMPFAQLHLGRSYYYDDGDGGDDSVIVELDLNLLKDLESLEVLLCNVDENENGGHYYNNDRRNNNFGGNKKDDGVTIPCKLNFDDLTIMENILICNNDEQQKMQIMHNTNPQQKKKQQEYRQQQQEQTTIIKLIDVAVESLRKDPLNEKNEPHLVFLAHSISASVVASAISTWKQKQLQLMTNNQSSHHHYNSLQRVEDLLHQAVTVVTFGNICKSFCDGPAYIHISMYDDPWTTALGSTNVNKIYGGRDAVYFHACSPYEHDQIQWEEARPQSSPITMRSSLKSHNAHNLNACIIQYLCLIMRINGIRSFRALYDAASFVDPTSVLDINPKHFAVNCNQGDLVVPPHLDDELLPAMIRATGGDQWLWKSDDNSGDSEDDDNVESLLPDEIETRSHLEESFGYGVLEDIYATCCR